MYRNHLDTVTNASASQVSDEEHLKELLLYRGVAWRIVPLAIICFLFSYFDRMNISFAKA